MVRTHLLHLTYGFRRLCPARMSLSQEVLRHTEMCVLTLSRNPIESDTMQA